MEVQHRHQCFVYDGSPSLQLPALASTIQQKLKEGYRCLYLNSSPMVAGLRSCLSAMGIDVANEVDQSRLVLSSAPITPGDDIFDGESLLRQLEESLDQSLNDGFKGLWASGDMAWEFGAEKNFEKLMIYEYGLEKLFRKRKELWGICQYHKDSLPRDVPNIGFMTHPSIFINETISRVNPKYAPFAITDF